MSALRPSWPDRGRSSSGPELCGDAREKRAISQLGIGPSLGTNYLPQTTVFGGIAGGTFEMKQYKNHMFQKLIPYLPVPPPLPGALYYYSEAGPKFGSCLGEHFPFVLGQ